MFDENLIDGLILAGWYVLESDFDEKAFLHWKRLASVCLGDLLGQDHVYVRFLKDYAQQAEEIDILAGKGILVAAREEIVKSLSDQAYLTPSEMLRDVGYPTSYCSNEEIFFEH